MANTAILSVRITGNGRDASRAFNSVQRDADRWARHMRTLSVDTVTKTVSGAAKAASNFSGAVALIGYAAPLAKAAIVSLGSAAVGAAAMMGAAFAVIKLGMDGIKAAAQQAAPAFGQLKTAVSGALEQSMIPGFQRLNGLLSTITPNMVGLARVIGDSFTSMSTAISTKGAGAVQGIIDNAGKFIQGITPGLESLLLGLLSLANQASSVLATTAPQVNQFLTDIGNRLAGVTAQSIVDSFNQLRDAAQSIWEKISPIVSAIQTMAQHATLMFQLAVAFRLIAIAIAAVRLAVTLWTVAQWALNAALLANPITWIVLAVVALIAVVVLIATKTTWFQTIWQTMCNVAVAAWGLITSAVSAFVGWITGVWASIVSGATAAWEGVRAAASAVWEGIKGVVQGVADFIGSAIGTACSVVSAAFSTVGSIASSVWGGMKSVIDAVGSAISTVVGWVQTLIGWLGNIKWPSMPGWLGGLFGGGMDAAFKAVPGGQDFFRFLPSATLLAQAPAPALSAAEFGPATGALGRGGGMQLQNVTVNITIEGAVDPMATARQVRELLSDLDKTTGMRTAVRL